jgi:hypothetical protein
VVLHFHFLPHLFAAPIAPSLVETGTFSDRREEKRIATLPFRFAASAERVVGPAVAGQI